MPSGSPALSPDVADDFPKPLDIKTTFINGIQHALYAPVSGVCNNAAWRALNREAISPEQIAAKTGLEVKRVTSLVDAITEVGLTAVAVINRPTAATRSKFSAARSRLRTAYYPR